MSLNGMTTPLEGLTGKITSIPPIDKTLTKEGHTAEAKAVGDALAKKVSITDIVDNLATNDSTRPLSAKQGAELKIRIDDIDPHFAENVIYDNENSGLSAEDVQSAIDEINENVTSRLKPTEVKTNNSSVKSDGVGEMLLSITDRNDNGNERYISISDKTKKGLLADSLKYVERDGNDYSVKNIFGDHNKPTGYYTGNGSATARTIDINSTGGVVLIYSNNAGERNICLATKIGAIAFRISGETTTKYMSAAVIFGDGKLSLGTADSSVNANGVNYYYQVL